MISLFILFLLFLKSCNCMTNTNTNTNTKSFVNQLNLKNNNCLINYFAYGSNLNYDVLNKRTGTSNAWNGRQSPSLSGSLLPPKRGVLRDYSLIFNVGQPPFPAFASVEKVVKSKEKDIVRNNKSWDNAIDKDEDKEVELEIESEVHGLVYSLNLQQFMAMLASEGYPLVYQIEPVLVNLYGSSSSSSSSSSRRRSVKAYTLRSHRGAMSHAPSSRYKELLIKGSEENGLDVKWIRRLKEIKTSNSPW